MPRELLDTVQARDGSPRFASGRPWHRPYLLSGLIKCAHCGKRFQAPTQVRGRAAAHHLCGGYIASGVSVCDAPRIGTAYLDDVVLDGIHKRIERVLDPERVRREIREILQPDRASDPVYDLDARLVETRVRIARLVQAACGRLVTTSRACELHS